MNKEIRDIIVEADLRDEILDLGYEEDMLEELLAQWEYVSYPEDLCSSLADSFVELYTAPLFELFSNHLVLVRWVEEAQVNGLLEGEGDLIKIMMAGQYQYNSYLLNQVLYYLQEEA